MGEITTILKEIAASLYMQPATIEELRQREFMRGKSEYGVQTFLNRLVEKDWCYMKGETYYTRKKFALSKEMSEYELHGLNEKYERPTIEQTLKNLERGKF